MRALFSRGFRTTLALTLAGFYAFAAAADETSLLLKKGGRLAIIGDSITEQKLYSVFIETYLTVCHPELAQDVCQFGWGGETAAGYLGRMENDTLSWFKPDAATLCYGMNDGCYTQLTPQIESRFEGPSVQILDAFRACGMQTVIGGPGAVDTRFFNASNPGRISPDGYNATLAGLSAAAERIAPAHGARFAPLHKTMIEAMARAKAANGADFPVCGQDGVHPGQNGHLVMTYVFLKGLGVGGDIAAINVHYADSTASASEGQTVLSAQNGVVELESARYPFCFSGDKTKPDTLSMLPFLPFNQELNRFMLTVRGLPWEKAKISWGDASALLTRDALEKGVNLADAFAADNPFKAPFAKVNEAVAAKQRFETTMIKTFINNLRIFANDPESKASVDAFTITLQNKRAALAKAVQTAFVPIRSTIKIEPAG